ncbi:MAG: hypothetical protein DYH08_07685 [Actinobacteria bacterium ATB1]|nr:hypothetical protein [Actinobacteria bacterium ATB1]
MFDDVLRRGVRCDVRRDPTRTPPAPGEFRMRGRTWQVVEVEAMWREWKLGDHPGSDPTDDVSDLEMWRVRAVARNAAGRTGSSDARGACVVVVLARDLVSGNWHVHSVWD